MVWHFKMTTIWLVFDNILFRLDENEEAEQEEDTSLEEWLMEQKSQVSDGILIGGIAGFAIATFNLSTLFTWSI